MFRSKTWLGLLAILGFGLCLAAFSMRSGIGAYATGVCVFYAVVASVFLIAQVIGFFVTQTQYEAQIEQPKYDLLELERLEWESSSKD